MIGTEIRQENHTNEHRNIPFNASFPLEWSKPRPLRRDKSGLPEFPISAMPEIPMYMAAAVAETTSTDRAMAATAILAAMSYCFSGVYRMQGKPDHTEPITLYSLILADPAERKSPVMKLIKAPFIEFVNEYNNANRQQIYASQEQRTVLENEIAEMQSKGSCTPDEIAAKRVALDNMRVLKFRNACVDDITPEALAAMLADNGSLLMLSDEAGVFKNFAGRYQNGVANLDLLLKAWGGESYQKNRCSNAPLILDSPYLSVCLCGQPYILEELMQNKSFLQSGLVARFLYCFPRSFVGQRHYGSKPINPDISADFRNLVYRALKAKTAHTGINGGKEIMLHFNDEAAKAFADYYDRQIEPSLLTDFAECPDWGGKYHGLILRLCGLIHCIKCVTEETPPRNRAVDTETLGQAIELAGYYKKQAIYAYGSVGSVGSDGGIADAEYMLNRLRSNGISTISGRELLHLCRKMKTMNEITETANVLVEHGYLREHEQEGSGGRKPTLLYEVNPLSA